MKFLFILFVTLFPMTLKAESFFNKDALNIEERMDFFNVPGISIAVVDGGEIILEEGFGTAIPSSLFQASTMGKPLTALAILKLVQQGIIDLDTDINQYLKTWTLEDTIHTRNRKITIRMLLTHTSGIHESAPKGYHIDDNLISLDDFLNGKGYKEAPKPSYFPGLKRRYSWSAYSILEKIIEDVTGESYGDYMKNNILEPLGMLDSLYSMPLIEEKKSSAIIGHNLYGDPIPGGWRNYPELAAMGLWTTATDMAKFTIEIQKILTSDYQGVVSKDSVEEMLSYDPKGWGLGVSIKFDSDNKIIRHSGKSSGYICYFISKVYRGKSIIIMTNGENAWKLIREIIYSIEDYKSWGI